MSIPIGTPQNHRPEIIVFVIGILFLIGGAILIQILPSDTWVFAAMFVIWGVGAIVNATMRYYRTQQKS